MSRWVLSSCIFVTSHAFHIDMVQNMQQKCYSLFISLSPLIYYQRKEPHVVTWKRQRSQSSFFIFYVGSSKLHTSIFSCTQKKYNMGDCRYLPRDTATTVTVERITVVLEGPSCLLCLPSHLIYDRLCEEATATWFVFLCSNMWVAFADIYGSSHSLLVRCY